MRTKEEVLKIDREIASQVIDDALKLGYNLSVFNGGDDPEIAHATDRQAILENMFACDADIIKVYKDKAFIGFVEFIYGNDGYDVISNSSCSIRIEQILQNANELSHKFADGAFG